MSWIKAAGPLALLVLTAACSPEPAERSRALWRDKAAPIWSAAAFQPARIAGSWHQAADFTTAARPGCAPGRLALTEAGGALRAEGQLCLNGALRPVSGPLTPAGPGRLRVGGMSDWWVIWVDSGYRSLAIATPDGSFGFVLDRGKISGDRLRAAAEIFDFNGYPKTYLRGF